MSPWIGLETLDISEQSIRLMLRFSTMLNLASKSMTVNLPLLTHLFGKLQLANLVGKSLVSSHQVVMVQILTMSALMKTEVLLLQVMILEQFVSTNSQS